MSGFADEYYECGWAQATGAISSTESRRIEETLIWVPEDVSTILDVGCGDGRITDRLLERHSVVGLDSSAEALKHVQAEHVLGDVTSLPFPERGFDLVLCCEVLEHLPLDAFERTLRELERVASRYVLITVPYRENLRRSMVKCTRCGCFFHNNRHLRSFDDKSMAGLLNGFDLIRKEAFLTRRDYPLRLLKLARRLRILSNLLPSPAVCPQCGFSPPHTGSAPSIDVSATAPRAGGIRLPWLRKAARHVLPKTARAGGWLLALYRRHDENDLEAN